MSKSKMEMVNGRKCRLSKIYLWRQADPARDVDKLGNPVAPNYFVVVRVKDCEKVVGEDGVLRYDPANAKQANKLGYGGTYYGYGKKEKVKRGRAMVLDGERTRSYLRTPVFLKGREGNIYVGYCNFKRENSEGAAQ